MIKGFITLIFLKIFCFAITAEVMMDDVRSNPVTKFEDKAIEVVNKESERLKRPLSEAEVDKLTKDLIKDDLLKAKISSVIVASIFSQDPNVALLTGSNAAQNNMIPLLLAGGMVLWEGYEIYHIYQTQGDEGLLRYLATAGLITVTTGIVGKGIKVAWKIKGVREPITNSALAVQA